MDYEFDPVPQVGTGTDLHADLARWIASPPLAALVSEFGGDSADLTAPHRTLADRFALLDSFTDRWDTRVDPVTGAQRERNEADELELTAQQQDLVLAAADAFGMRKVHPPQHTDYDHVFMLGGLIRACFNRPAYAAHLIRVGAVRTKSVVALGGHRAFRGDEPALAAAAGHPDLAEEYEALDRGTRLAFGLAEPTHVEGEESELVGGRWSVRHYAGEQGVQIIVAAAPSSLPSQRRADTADTYAWFATTLAHLSAGQRVLAVTSPIYVNQQHAAAIRRLGVPYSVEVETIGNDPALVPPALDQPFSQTKYLMEIRSTVRAFRALLDLPGG